MNIDDATNKIKKLFELKKNIQSNGISTEYICQYKGLVSDKRKRSIEQDIVNHINAELVELFETNYLGDSALVKP